ncbi:MAG: imidazoleglycerol-phosphate dehydratase HisB [Chloroflexi bacterium]|nr:imidazoleglycerol-phosphate dehydratase HisB [Chloroflexota bacterium]
MADRSARVARETKETKISVELGVDGSGRGEIRTGIGFLDHLLQQIAKHGMFDLKVEATGDLHIDAHHTVEDVAISLGRAFDQALGQREGIVRMAHAMVPLDESLALVAVDISGRGYAVVEAEFAGASVGDLPTSLLRHFLESFAVEARANLHVRVLSGLDDHHKAEAVFKALARALDEATKIDPRRMGQVPSTKGVIGTG